MRINEFLTQLSVKCKDQEKEIQQLKQQLELLLKRNEELKLNGQQCVSAYYELVGMLDARTLDISKRINFCWKDCYAVFGKDLNFESKPDFTKFAKSIAETRSENIILKQQLEEKDEEIKQLKKEGMAVLSKLKEAVEVIEFYLSKDLSDCIFKSDEDRHRQFLAKYREEK